MAHSHLDHVMDSPEVAQRTGATLFGSESSLNVGRGGGLVEDAMLRKPLRALPFFVDDFTKTRKLLQDKTADSVTEVRFQGTFETIDPLRRDDSGGAGD